MSCEVILLSHPIWRSGDDVDFDDMDDVNCPMNGFSSTFYSIETIADIDTDGFASDAPSDSSGSDPEDDEDIESEFAMFVVAVNYAVAGTDYLPRFLFLRSHPLLQEIPHCRWSSPIDLRRCILNHFKHRLH